MIVSLLVLLQNTNELKGVKKGENIKELKPLNTKDKRTVPMDYGYKFLI